MTRLVHNHFSSEDEPPGSIGMSIETNAISHTKLLSRLERDLDTWSWDYRGLAYWPLIRTSLRRLLLEPIAVPVAKPSVEHFARPSTASGNLPRMSRDEIYRFWWDAFVWASGQVDVLMVARREDAVDLVSGRYHDRLVDPLWRLAHEMGLNVLKVTGSRAQPTADLPLAIPSIVIYPDNHADLDISVSLLPELNDMLQHLKTLGVDLTARSGELRSSIKRTIHREAVFGALLDRCRPRMVVLGVFDDPVQMAMVAACRRRGILVVDIQHGSQGPRHLACTKWENIPANGSELIPDRFWVWGKPTADRISSAFGPNIRTHLPLIGGNAWLAEWTSGIHAEGEPASDFLDTQERFEKCVLVCLQPLSDPLPPTLLKALQDSPANWCWWIRLHRKQKGYLEQIKAQIASTGATFEIEAPSRLPLYPLLLAADHHLTGWSTVAFEAEALGCPTTLFHPLAGSFLNEEIAEGRFNWAKSGAELLSFVALESRSDAAGTANGRHPHIIADRKLSESALRSLLDVDPQAPDGARGMK